MISQNCISTTETASVLGVSMAYVHQMIVDRRLKPIGRIGYNYILDRYEVESLLKARQEEKKRRPNDRRLK